MTDKKETYPQLLYIEDSPPMEGCSKSFTSYPIKRGTMFLGKDDLYTILTKMDELIDGLIKLTTP